MIRTKNDLKQYLLEDAKANGVTSNYIKYLISLFYCIESCHAYRYIKTMRYCEYHLNNRGLFHKLLYLYYKTKWSRLGFRYNIHVPLNVAEAGLRLVHISGGGIILNATSIGRNCTFNAGVILGNSSKLEDKPIIGDGVVFNPGSKAFGRVFVGNKVIVAANAVITKDVIDNVAVGGVPAEIIKHL